MCGFDDKRYLLANGIESLAFGHKDIPGTVREVESEGDAVIILSANEALNRGVGVAQAFVRLIPSNRPGVDPHVAGAEMNQMLDRLRERVTDPTYNYNSLFAHAPHPPTQTGNGFGDFFNFQDCRKAR